MIMEMRRRAIQIPDKTAARRLRSEDNTEGGCEGNRYWAPAAGPALRAGPG
jgi:hypothetical protein